MPAVSQNQFKAMQAAAHGNSTLGIPKSVGQDFAAATPNPSSLPKRASSALEAHTGMSKGKKKTRRGGGRHQADPKAQEHMATMAAHMAVGNEDGVKKAALALANHLHRKSKAAATNHAKTSPGTVSQGTDHPSPKDNAPSFAPTMTTQVAAGTPINANTGGGMY